MHTLVLTRTPTHTQAHTHTHTHTHIHTYTHTYTHSHTLICPTHTCIPMYTHIGAVVYILGFVCMRTYVCSLKTNPVTSYRAHIILVHLRLVSTPTHKIVTWRWANFRRLRRRLLHFAPGRELGAHLPDSLRAACLLHAHQVPVRRRSALAAKDGSEFAARKRFVWGEIPPLSEQPCA